MYSYNFLGITNRLVTCIINKAKYLKEREATTKELLSSYYKALRITQRELDKSLS